MSIKQLFCLVHLSGVGLRRGRLHRLPTDTGPQTEKRMKKKIHINQHVIRSNKKNNKTDPVITVKTSKSNTYASEVEILGKSKLIYSPNKPLACGARVWIETDEKIVLDNGITIE